MNHGVSRTLFSELMPVLKVVPYVPVLLKVIVVNGLLLIPPGLRLRVLRLKDGKLRELKLNHLLVPELKSLEEDLYSVRVPKFLIKNLNLHPIMPSKLLLLSGR